MMKLALLTNVIEKNVIDNNIGDVFIGRGLKYILEKTIHPKKIEWFIINRFSKFSTEDMAIMRGCDFIVYGGMPQYNNLDDWKFYYDDEMWDDLNSLNVPILRLAGGGGYPSEMWTPDEFAEHLNSSEYTRSILVKSLLNTHLITTRDKMAQTFLKSNRVISTLLPCSGTFACLNYGITKTDKTINAISFTSHYVEKNEYKDIIIDEIKKTKKYLEDTTGKPCILFAQVKEEDLKFMQEHFKDFKTFDTQQSLLEFYSHVDICVSSRLHAVLPVHGIGGRSIMIRVDTRAVAVEEVEIPIIPLSNFTSAGIIDIIENDKFSKKNMDETINESVEFYKGFFDTIHIK